MIDTANQRYALVGRASIYHVPVHDELTAAVAASVTDLRDWLWAADELDGEWGILARRAMAAARAIWAVPLEASHPFLCLDQAGRFLASRVRAAEQVHGSEFARLLGQTADLLAEIFERGESPFRNALVAELCTSPSRIVVIRRSGAVTAVRASLAQIGLDVPVCTPATLRDAQSAELVCACGVTKQFPPSLITAPQGARVAFVHPDWMHDASETPGIFGSQGGLAVRVRWEPTHHGDKDIDDLEHQPDWDAIARQGPGEQAWALAVRAHLFVVAGPRRVFVEDEPEAELTLVEPGARPGDRVRRERVGRIVVGDFVLLRDGYGSEDAIRLLADQILGADAPRLRASQEKWKVGLREAAARDGVSRVEDELARRGAQARNLRYWLSTDSIKPAAPQDLAIALDFAGLKDQAESVWRDLERIKSAHLQAGQRLRHLLEEEIERADMEALHITGELSVRLAVDGGGSLGVYRVEQIAPETVEIPSTWLRIAQRIEGDLWHG